MQIGIVGGGRAAVAILKSFKELKGYTILKVCDVNQNSPGIILAKNMGIATTTDLDEIMSDLKVEAIMELTGSNEVLSKVNTRKKDHQTIIPSYIAKILFDLMSSHDSISLDRTKYFMDKTAEISTDINSAMDPIHTSETNITHLLDEAAILNINGKIEAARAGEHGKTFAVVVGRLSKLTDQIEASLNLIRTASTNIKTALSTLAGMKDSIEQTLSKE